MTDKRTELIVDVIMDAVEARDESCSVTVKYATDEQRDAVVGSLYDLGMYAQWSGDVLTVWINGKPSSIESK